MTQDEKIEALFSIVETQMKALMDTQIQLTAVSTAFIGVLRALDKQPDLVPLIATEIAGQAERMESIYLGSPLSEETLEMRARVLQDLLPQNVRELVQQSKP